MFLITNHYFYALILFILKKPKNMKKVLLAAIVLMSAQAGFSQISKGNWLVGGSAGFASEKQGDFKTTTVNISPDAGYFFIDHFAAGLRVGFTSAKETGTDAVSAFAVAPFARYYFLPTAQTVNVFADGEYGFGSAKSSGVSASVNEFKISAGPAVFVSPSVALEFALYYQSMGGKYYVERANTFGLNIGFQVHLGGSKK